MGLMMVRIKKHRWHKKIQKSNDPLVFSLGWRRFQSIPTYCMQDQNDRFRFVKYTPEHSHCIATFFAPQVPPNTGVMGFQTLSSKKATFRVSVTGYTLEVSQAFEVVKKLKLTGSPFKIFKNTAFIKDMFHTSLEVSKFQGAKLRTVSGIRGQVKRAIKAGTGHGEGCYRASFEDKILMSDIVFLRAWVPVAAQRFFNPVMTHCIADPEEWVALRTQNAVRNEMGVPIPSQGDSNYTEIERVARRFNKLRVPTTLTKALPFASKPKVESKKRPKKELPEYAERNKLLGRVKVLEPEERKRYALLQQLRTVRNEKEFKKKGASRKRREEHLKEKAKIDEKKRLAGRAAKKREYAMQGLAAAREASKRARMD